MKKQQARKNINFRETHSERSATASYRAFTKFIKRPTKFMNIKHK